MSPTDREDSLFMQNRFVGDIGDFGKYGMLRCVNKSGYRLGINWYLTEDGADDAGMLTDYLTKNQSDYSECDLELHAVLQNLIENGKRDVKNIENSTLFSKETVYFSDVLQPGCDNRLRWFENSLEWFGGCDILFLDPDNNIAMYDNMYCNQATEVRYAYSREIEAYYRQGSSVIVYNHANRQTQTDFFKRFLFANGREFKGATTFVLKFNRQQVRYYLFVLRPEHVKQIEDQVDILLNSAWGKRRGAKKPHFEKISLL